MQTTLFSSKVGDINTTLAFVNNLSAVTDPGASNDTSSGYSVGSQWVNTALGTVYVCVNATAGAAVWVLLGAVEILAAQGAPVAATVSATLTAANLLVGIITVLQGAGAASAQQLPLATALDTALSYAQVNQSFDFSVINISTTAAEAASITTNTGWTLVGDMDIIANSASTTKSAGRFRARKTGTGTWTLYRIS